MSKITIESTDNSIKVDFGDYAPLLERSKGVWTKGNITSFKLSPMCVEASILSEKLWCVSFDGSNETLKIDTVDGLTPTSNEDLYNKLAELIA